MIRADVRNVRDSIGRDGRVYTCLAFEDEDGEWSEYMVPSSSRVSSGDTVTIHPTPGRPGYGVLIADTSHRRKAA